MHVGSPATHLSSQASRFIKELGIAIKDTSYGTKKDQTNKETDESGLKYQKRARQKSS